MPIMAFQFYRQLFVFVRLTVLLVLLATIVGILVWHDYQHFMVTPLFQNKTRLIYDIKSGASLKKVATDLTKLGVLDHPWYFVLLARVEGKAGKIKTGEYRITSSVLPRDLLEQFVTGRVIQHAFTIVEGWSFRQVRDALANNKILQHTLSAVPDSAIMAQLGKPASHPEGWFYPDTYYFARGSTDLEVLRRALKTMGQKLQKLWQMRDLNLLLTSPYQALILASIVEKESALTTERARIAGVFLRRLQKKMRLQSDPTVIYGIGAMFDGDIKKRDLRKDTPYNTYVHKGLPPTPIGMPSKESLEAVMHPQRGLFLYFVADGTGGHAFSTTLREHNAAVRRYRLRRK